MTKVTIDLFDTTLRDGAQSLPHSNQFGDGTKHTIADTIACLGIGVIEAGFPATPEDGQEVARVAETVGQTSYDVATWNNAKRKGIMGKTPIIAGLSRATEGDISATWQAIQAATFPRIHTFISTSDFHRKHKFPGVSRQQLLEIGVDAVKFAREISKDHSGVSVEFSAEAASTTDSGYLQQVVLAAVVAGADVINLPDTVGERSPTWMLSFYRQALEWILRNNPDIILSAHNHNDLGNACANSFMLVQAAAEYAHKHQQPVRIQIESTICGLGERAGNADIFSIASNLYKFTSEFDVEVAWGFNPGKSVSSAHTIMNAARLTVDRQAPVVGRDTNVHRSGIHSDGVIKGGHAMYTPFDPTFWGHDVQAVHEDGKYQGKTGKQAARRQ